MSAKPLRDPLEPALTDTDLMRVLGIRKSKFYAHKREGRFDHLKIRPLYAGQHTRYSRTKVQQWLDGWGSPQTEYGMRKLRDALRKTG